MFKKRFYLVPGLLLAMSLTSCNTEVEQNRAKGRVCFAVEGNTHFNVVTRLADTSLYADASNFTLDIYEGNVLKFSGKLSELAESSLELEAGDYVATVHYGDNVVKTQGNFRVEGSKAFTVIENRDAEVSIECTPVVARLTTEFAPEMSNYFSDYTVTYESQSLVNEATNVVWTKGNTEPWYVRVKDNEMVTATIHVVRTSDGATADVERQLSLSPAKAWKLNVAPTENTVEGDYTITVSVDESTNDKTESITVPNDWWLK